MANVFKEFTKEKLDEIRTHSYYKKARETIIERADHYTVTDPPVMKFSKLHMYVTNGNREMYERDHVEYETRMHALFFAYVITEDEKYLEPLADIIWNICDFEPHMGARSASPQSRPVSVSSSSREAVMASSKNIS